MLPNLQDSDPEETTEWSGWREEEVDAEQIIHNFSAIDEWTKLTRSTSLPSEWCNYIKLQPIQIS